MENGTEGEPGLLERWARKAGRRIRQMRGTEPRTRVQIRCEGVAHGGWWICPLALRPDDVAYCIDRGSDLALEKKLILDYGVRTYIFDPEPGTAERADDEGLLDEGELRAIRVGGTNRPAQEDLGPDGARMVRIGDLMRMLGHRRLDLLKIDVESAEEILRDLVVLGADVRQLLVTFPRLGSETNRDRIEGIVDDLQGVGYRIFRISPDGRRYSFLRTDFPST